MRKIRHEFLRIVSIICILCFGILPLVTLLFNVSGEDFSFIIGDPNFKSAVLNSLIYTLCAAVITTFLAIVCAYLLDSSNIKNKNLFVVLLTLGMLVPTISIGLGIRIMFGSSGLLDILFGINIEGRGFLGLIMGSVIASFPATFLIIYDALRYEDKGVYDAASILGIKRFSSFFRITLPYLKIAIMSAFFACFTLIFSDYGIPMEVAGKVKTLPMYLYEQFMSTFKYGRGSFVGLILLIPAIVSFLFDIIFKDESANEKQRQLIKSSRTYDRTVIFVLVLVVVLLFTPQLSFISLTFMKSFPNDLSFTSEHVLNVFSNTYGVGLVSYIVNSLKIAFLTALIGMVFAYLLAYLSVRKSGRFSKVVDLLSLSTIAIPGLVLGIGYIFLFSKTNGYFYGTVAILVVVNIIHFLGSPYLLAKNCLSKINSEYEVIGETLGISKFGIIKNVLIPNSTGTLIEMFSYFFLNSMITISAVAFLCTYFNQPLSILITSYEKSGNYEMQSVISFIILLINILFRTITSILLQYVNKKQNKEFEENRELERIQFDALVNLEKGGKSNLDLIDETLVNQLMELDYVNVDINNKVSISEKGLKVLEPYRVRKAIILAAGFGQRLAPVTLDTPKPLVKVNGVRILDSLIDSLIAKGITNITIVRGYKKEQFDELKEKYPDIVFADNADYNVTNNISSLMKVIDKVDRCYICEADLIINNPDVINKYEYNTNFLGFKVDETDDWCATKEGNYIGSYRQGGENCYQVYGISYWNSSDSEKLKEDIKKVYNSRGGKENLWEMVPLRIANKNYRIEIRECNKKDITEIDNFSELCAVDYSYSNYPGHENY